jgi:hypothetical protein
MVFIKPTILRDGSEVATETNSKYNFMRNLQLQQNSGRVPLQPDEHQPLLPSIDDAPLDLRRPKPATHASQSADKPSAAPVDHAAIAPVTQ